MHRGPATTRTTLLAVGFGPNPSEKPEWPTQGNWVRFQRVGPSVITGVRRLLAGHAELLRQQSRPWRLASLASDKTLV